MEKNNIYLLMLIFIGCSFAYLLPNHYYPWISAYQDFSSFLVLLVMFTVFLKNKLILDLKFFVICLIAVIPLIQVMAHKIFFFGDGLVAFIYILSFGLAYLAALNLGRQEHITNYLLLISSIFIF